MVSERKANTYRKLRSMLAALVLVGAYLVATLGVSSVALTTGSTSAEARGKKKSGRGRRGGSRRGRSGRRGRRGPNCSIILWNLGLC